MKTKKLKALEAVSKARRELFSFAMCRSQYNDIFRNYQTLITYLRLEKNLVNTYNELHKINRKEKIK